MKLTIWGKQEKTEIGGFYMIGDAERMHACTAYVSSLHDAKLYCAAHELLEALEAVRRHGLIEKDGYETIVKQMNEAIAKAKYL